MRPAADARGVRLEAVLDPRAGPVSGDAGAAAAGGVEPGVERGQVHAARRRACRCASTGSTLIVEIVVSDTGIGIPPEFLPHVFERFRQADGGISRERGGLGLGLAIVHHLVEMHGGTIVATSEGEGRGATFRVMLPIVESGAGAAPA